MKIALIEFMVKICNKNSFNISTTFFSYDLFKFKNKQINRISLRTDFQLINSNIIFKSS